MKTKIFYTVFGICVACVANWFYYPYWEYKVAAHNYKKGYLDGRDEVLYRTIPKKEEP